MSGKNIDFILKRKSCRRFSSRPLEEGDLGLLMEALRRAPSAGNCQAWFFYVVSNEKGRKALARAAWGQDFVAQAPVVFVVCGDPEESGVSYGERGRTLYCLQDTAAAVENLLIAATALGYGCCWVGAFDEGEARRALDIPIHLRPVAIVPVGFGQPERGYTSRKSVEDIFKMVD